MTFSKKIAIILFRTSIKVHFLQIFMRRKSSNFDLFPNRFWTVLYFRYMQFQLVSQKRKHFGPFSQQTHEEVNFKHNILLMIYFREQYHRTYFSITDHERGCHRTLCTPPWHAHGAPGQLWKSSKDEPHLKSILDLDNISVDEGPAFMLPK